MHSTNGGLMHDSDADVEKARLDHIEELRRQQTQYEIPEHIDKAVNRKFDRHLVPWLFGIWYPDSPISETYAIC